MNVAWNESDTPTTRSRAPISGPLHSTHDLAAPRAPVPTSGQPEILRTQFVANLHGVTRHAIVTGNILTMPRINQHANRIHEMADLHGTANVSLTELTSTDLDGFLDLLSDRAFPNDSYRAVGMEYEIVDHTADGITLQVSAGIDPVATE